MPAGNAAPSVQAEDETGQDDMFDLPMQPDEDQVRTVLPGYGATAEPVAPSTQEPSPARPDAAPDPARDAVAQGADQADGAVPAEHRDFVSSTRDLLRDVESVLEERSQ